MKDICLVSPTFDEYIGGMETHGYEFAKCFLNDSINPIRSILTKKKIKYGTPLDNNYTSKSALTSDLVKSILSGDFKEDAQTIMDNSNFPETILYMNSPTWTPVCSIIKEKYPDTKIIIRTGGNDIIAGWIGEGINDNCTLEESRSKLVTMLNRYTDYLIVNSEYSLNRMLSVGIEKSILKKVIGGVDCKSFLPKKQDNSDCVNILTVGRLVEFKGIEYCLDTIRKVMDTSKKNISYTIIGDGPYKEVILNNIKSNPIKNIKIVGAQRIELMPEYFKTADILLHMPISLCKYERESSYIHTETMGRCLCEASASGLPIIATNVGGISEIVINEKTGFLIPEKDISAAAKKLNYLIDNYFERIKLGFNGRKRAVELFDWNYVFDEYKKLFNKV